MIDLSDFPIMDIESNYDSYAFKSMGYVLVDFQ